MQRSRVDGVQSRFARKDAEMQISRVYWDNGCQAIKLPHGFWISANQVQIGRQGSSILITPMDAVPFTAAVPVRGHLAGSARPEDIGAIFGQLAANDNQRREAVVGHPGRTRGAGVFAGRVGRALCGWLKFR
jgi:hypothetical protein